MHIMVQWIKYKARRKLAVKKKKKFISISLKLKNQMTLEYLHFTKVAPTHPVCIKIQENNEPNMAASIKYVQK